MPARVGLPAPPGLLGLLPLPESFFDDPDAFADMPRSATVPYKVLRPGTHNAVIELRPNEDVPGEREVQNGGADLVAYTDEDRRTTTSSTVNLDIVNNVPAVRLRDLRGRAGRPRGQPAGSAVIQVVNVPEYDEELSRARPVCCVVRPSPWPSTVSPSPRPSSPVPRTPATDFILAGHQRLVRRGRGQRGPRLQPGRGARPSGRGRGHGPGRRRLQPLQIASNADSRPPVLDRRRPATASASALGIDCEFDPYPTFDEFLDARDNEQIKGLFRGGWQADYPAMSNFLGPIYGTALRLERHGLLDQGVRRQALKEANGETRPGGGRWRCTRRARPSWSVTCLGIPLWYKNATGGLCEAVENVRLRLGQRPDPVPGDQAE